MDELKRLAGRLATGALAGAACGVLVGGIGGRVAMFVLRLTSDNAIRGRETDDGFKIGSVTGSTIFLLVATALIGVLGGLLYLIARRFVPEELRVPAGAALFGVLGSTAILKPGHFDFTRVQPHTLSVIFFTLIPIGFGALLPIVAERWLARGAPPWPAFFLLVPVGLGGPVLVAFLALVLVGFAIVRMVPALRTAWRSNAATWIGRGALAAGFGYGAFVLIDEANQII
ncbi:MAG: precorrin-6A/cobalt-precorrin-6A reductase [Actinomycetota bacterium]|nr:precorrin-6A/cobalt-precorrin-6A reductase [Actinomycetota bacterium]